MERENAIYRYEEMILTGARFSLNGTPSEKKKNALDIVRYVITDLLGWTPKQAMELFTPEVVRMMGLEYIIDTYVECPPDIDKHVDTDYIVYLAFPLEVRYDPTDKLIKMYKKIMTGEKLKFPRNYFAGNEGRYKASILLMYVINQNIILDKDGSEKLYEMFGNNAYINKKLKEWRIYDVCVKIYHSPIDFLHYSLPEELANNFYYANYSFNNVYREYEKEYLRKQKERR